MHLCTPTAWGQPTVHDKREGKKKKVPVLLLKLEKANLQPQNRVKAHLPSELVHALEDLVPGPESEPGEQAEVLVHVPFRGRFLEDNL